MAFKPTVKTILIIDDNADVANVLAEVLRTHGHITHTAYGPREGIVAIADLEPDIVFLDIGMPEINGYEVAAKIRAGRGEHQPYLIAYTAWDDSATLRRVMLAGFNRHIAKTSPIEDLMEAIAQVNPDPIL